MQRDFIIGDKWLYYKIYCGPKTADFLLTEVIYQILELLRTEDLIQSWFFIRYHDPENHIRVRFNLTDLNKLGKVISIINKEISPHIESGHVNKIQIDTYKRELERYGSSSMELSEALFGYESDMLLGMIDLIEGEEGETIRWMFGLRAIDQLLEDFELKLEEKYRILNELATGFENEFNANSILINQLSSKYRASKKEIFHFMNRELDVDSPYSELFELLSEKSQDSRLVVNQIIALKLDGGLELELNNLLKSYIHMLMNRLFRSSQRLHEMVIYGFLVRYYKTILARQKYN